MNRDELLTRGAAQPPEIHRLSGVTAMFPADVEGGTWIGATEHGDTWALLNRNGGRRSAKNVSRGQLVLGALAASDPKFVSSFLKEVGLFNFLPFRLFGISLVEKQVREWTWDGEELSLVTHSWRSNHWFSSGVSDQKAGEMRGKVFETARHEPDYGTREWLARIHRSHEETPGAFSVCVHREDAATVSYTEIEVGDSIVQMRYQPGSPCHAAPLLELSLPLIQPEWMIK